MNGVGLTTVGRLLGHRRRRTTAIYAHLDDAALQDAAALTATVIARAMEYRTESLPLPEELPKEPSNTSDGENSSVSKSGDSDRSSAVRECADEPVHHRCGPAVSGKASDVGVGHYEQETQDHESTAEFSGRNANTGPGAPP